MIDVAQLEKEKTLDVWQELECGYGSLHLLVTVSGTARSPNMDNIPTTTGVHVPPAAEDYVSIEMFGWLEGCIFVTWNVGTNQLHSVKWCAVE